jgi:hypothetical protein
MNTWLALKRRALLEADRFPTSSRSVLGRRRGSRTRTGAGAQRTRLKGGEHPLRPEAALQADHAVEVRQLMELVPATKGCRRDSRSPALGVSVDLPHGRGEGSGRRAMGRRQTGIFNRRIVAARKALATGLVGVGRARANVAYTAKTTRYSIRGDGGARNDALEHVKQMPPVIAARSPRVRSPQTAG